MSEPTKEEEERIRNGVDLLLNGKPFILIYDSTSPEEQLGDEDELMVTGSYIAKRHQSYYTTRGMIETARDYMRDMVGFEEDED